MDFNYDQEDLNRVGTLEELSEQRRLRLEQLKKDTFERQNANQTNQPNEFQLPKPKFRSYNPTDNSLKENKLPHAEPESIEDHIREQLNALNDNSMINEVDLTTLAPRKIDWDLKRNIESKLQKLDKRTEKAINELIREKLDKAFEQED